MSKPKVLLVDDHPLFRQGVRWVLEENGIEIVGEAEDASTALELVEQLEPDIALIDINLPGVNGLELTRIMKQRHPSVQVLILSIYEDDEQLFQAIKAGAAAYFSKDVDPDTLLQAIRRIARGEYVINDAVLSNPRVAGRVLDQFRELSQREKELQNFFRPLTDREMEILDCIAQGMSNKEIAYHLGISPQTVKNHISSILRKLAVNDRTQAVIYALRKGWIRVTPEEGAE